MIAFDLPADDFEEVLDPGIFVEERDKDKASEFDRQRRFLALLKKQAPAVKARAFANAGKSTDWERVQRWREGKVAGSLDLILRWKPRETFWAEMKDGTGMPTKAQIDELNSLHRDGFRCGVYRSARVLLQHLRDAGAPFL